MKESVIRSIEDYIKFIHVKSGIKNSVLYRGHSKSSYQLCPTLFRGDLKNIEKKMVVDGNGKEYKELEKMIIDRFKTHSNLLMEREPKTYFEWLCLAQHHGVPTRLLDWTANPMAALYFCVRSNPGTDGAVYKIVPSNSQRYENISIETQPAQITFVHPPFFHKRVAAQKGCFSLHPHNEKDRDTEKIFQEVDKKFFEKAVIPAKRKYGLLNELHKIGVDAFTLFQNLESLGEKINSELKIQFGPGIDSDIYRERYDGKIRVY